MGYSKSKKSVRKYESYLKQLIEAKASILFTSKNPQRLGNKLREAIYASQFYDDTKQYANISSKFMLRMKNNGIYCELRDAVDFDAEIVKESLKQEIVIKDVSTLPGIIGAIVKYKGNTMIFLDFVDNEIDMAPLDRFCEKFDYTYSLNPLTLIKNDVNY